MKRKSIFKYLGVENERLRAMATKIASSREDTVFVVTSRLCPTCSVYNGRIYSLYGKYKAFPLLPDFLHNDVCPVCGTYIGFSHYFPNISGNLKQDIIFGNRALVDSRTNEEKRIWRERENSKKLNIKMEKDYKWICENLPTCKPKTIGGYKKMANSNSKNYQKIVYLAKQKGYMI